MVSKRKTKEQLEAAYRAQEKKYADSVKKLEAVHKKQMDAYYAKMNKLSNNHSKVTRRLLEASVKAKK